jgi:hypothetical protein
LRPDCRSGQGTTVLSIHFSDSIFEQRRPCGEQRDEAIQTPLDKHWIASQSLSSGAHSRPLARDDGIGPGLAAEQARKKLSPGAEPRFILVVRATLPAPMP